MKTLCSVVVFVLFVTCLFAVPATTAVAGDSFAPSVQFNSCVNGNCGQTFVSNHGVVQQRVVVQQVQVHQQRVFVQQVPVHQQRVVVQQVPVQQKQVFVQQVPVHQQRVFVQQVPVHQQQVFVQSANKRANTVSRSRSVVRTRSGFFGR